MQRVRGFSYVHDDISRCKLAVANGDLVQIRPHMLPHLLLHPQNFPHGNLFFLRQEISKIFDFPLGLLGHPALHNCPLLRSVPMRSKYMFVRYRLQVCFSRKFLTTSCKKRKLHIKSTPNILKRLSMEDYPSINICSAWRASKKTLKKKKKR